MKFFVKILCLIIFGFLFLTSKDNTKYLTLTFLDGTQVSIKTEKIKETNYISIQQINKIVFPESKYIKKKHELKIRNSRLKFTPNSFFMIYDLNEDIRISQFHHPVLIKRRKLMIPLQDFVSALKKLELFDITINNWDADSEKIQVKQAIKKNVEITYKPGIVTNVEEDNHLSQPVEVHKVDYPSKETIIEKSADFQHNALPNYQENFFKSSFRLNSGEFLKGINSIYSIKLSKRRIGKRSSEIEKKLPYKNKNPNNLVEKEYPPNVYVLPSKLKREEIENHSK